MWSSQRSHCRKWEVLLILTKLPEICAALADRVKALVIPCVSLLAQEALNHRPSAPDSAGTAAGCNEWGKSMPHAGSLW